MRARVSFEGQGDLGSTVNATERRERVFFKGTVTGTKTINFSTTERILSLLVSNDVLSEETYVDVEIRDASATAMCTVRVYTGGSVLVPLNVGASSAFISSPSSEAQVITIGIF